MRLRNAAPRVLFLHAFPRHHTFNCAISGPVLPGVRCLYMVLRVHTKRKHESLPTDSDLAPENIVSDIVGAILIMAGRSARLYPPANHSQHPNIAPCSLNLRHAGWRACTIENYLQESDRSLDTRVTVFLRVDGCIPGRARKVSLLDLAACPHSVARKTSSTPWTSATAE